MQRDLHVLTKLLPVQMTAVHQQFMHILFLGQTGGTGLRDRITAVDNEDFKTAMRIVELLVQRSVPIALASRRFQPGSDPASILRAERRMERRFAQTLDGLEADDADICACLHSAAAPRAAYRAWLDAEIARQIPASSQPVSNDDTALGDLLAHLMVLMELSLLHAYLHRQLGRHRAADDAWRLSGAAMIYGRALVERGARNGVMPMPSALPRVAMERTEAAAFDAEIALTQRCAALGRRAAEQREDGAERRLIDRIVEDCRLTCDRRWGDAFPARFGRSPVFESFAASCERSALKAPPLA